MTDSEEKTVKEVTNALLEEFAVGDDVIVRPNEGKALLEFPYINGCITKVIAISDKPESTHRYQIGIKDTKGDNYVWAKPSALHRYKMPETP